MVVGGEVRAVKQAELSIVNNKRRSILKVLTPIPVIAQSKRRDGGREIRVYGGVLMAVLLLPMPTGADRW